MRIYNSDVQKSHQHWCRKTCFCSNSLKWGLAYGLKVCGKNTSFICLQVFRIRIQITLIRIPNNAPNLFFKLLINTVSKIMHPVPVVSMLTCPWSGRLGPGRRGCRRGGGSRCSPLPRTPAQTWPTSGPATARNPS